MDGTPNGTPRRVSPNGAVFVPWPEYYQLQAAANSSAGQPQVGLGTQPTHQNPPTQGNLYQSMSGSGPVNPSASHNITQAQSLNGQNNSSSNQQTQSLADRIDPLLLHGSSLIALPRTPVTQDNFSLSVPPHQTNYSVGNIINNNYGDSPIQSNTPQQTQQQQQSPTPIGIASSVNGSISDSPSSENPPAQQTSQPHHSTTAAATPAPTQVENEGSASSQSHENESAQLLSIQSTTPVIQLASPHETSSEEQGAMAESIPRDVQLDEFLNGQQSAYLSQGELRDLHYGEPYSEFPTGSLSPGDDTPWLEQDTRPEAPFNDPYYERQAGIWKQVDQAYDNSFQNQQQRYPIPQFANPVPAHFQGKIGSQANPSPSGNQPLVYYERVRRAGISKEEFEKLKHANIQPPVQSNELPWFVDMFKKGWTAERWLAWLPVARQRNQRNLDATGQGQLYPAAVPIDNAVHPGKRPSLYYSEKVRKVVPREEFEKLKHPNIQPPVGSHEIQGFVDNFKRGMSADEWLARGRERIPDAAANRSQEQPSQVTAPNNNTAHPKIGQKYGRLGLLKAGATEADFATFVHAGIKTKGMKLFQELFKRTDPKMSADEFVILWKQNNEKVSVEDLENFRRHRQIPPQNSQQAHADPLAALDIPVNLANMDINNHELTDDEVMKFAVLDAGFEADEYQKLINAGLTLRGLYDFLLDYDSEDLFSVDEFLRNRGPQNAGKQKELTDGERANLKQRAARGQAKESGIEEERRSLSLLQ